MGGVVGEKACRICGQVKPLTAFHRAVDMRDGHRGECRECSREIARARYRADPEKAKASVKRWQQENAERLNAYRRARNATPEVKRRLRDGYYRRTYGISADDFDEMYAEQDGRCAICGTTPEKQAQMHVDHHHETGAIRQLLCSCCNQALGQMKDDPALLRAAADYLDRHAGTGG
jgi:hypothetical protein